MNLFAILIRGEFFYVIDYINSKKIPALDAYIANYAIAPEECASDIFYKLITDIKNDLGIQLAHIELKDIYRLKTDE